MKQRQYEQQKQGNKENEIRNIPHNYQNNNQNIYPVNNLHHAHFSFQYSSKETS